MLLFGCLIGLAIAFAPRIMLILAWLFGSRWDEVWQGNWLLPLLGIIFLPYTTVMYLLVWSSVTGISGWDWIWIILGVVLDISKWAQIANNRRGIPGYPQGTTVGAQQSAYVSPAGVGQPPATEVAPAQGEAELAKLADLRDKGILTEEEYQAKKKQVEEGA